MPALSSLPPTSSKSSFSTASVLSSISALEAQLRSTPTDLNPLPALLDHLSTSLDALETSKSHSKGSGKVIHAAAYALHRAFGSVIRQGRLHGRLRGPEGEEAESVKLVRKWTQERYTEYTDALVRLVGLDEAVEAGGLRLDGLTILMALVRAETEALTNLGGGVKHRFPSETWEKVVRALVLPGGGQGRASNEIRAEFVLRYFNFCDDVRFHFLATAGSLCASYFAPSTTTKPPPLPPYFTHNLLAILESLTSMPTTASEIDQFWTLRPTAPAGNKRKGSAASRRQRKKARVVPDGSTGIFDSSSEDEEGAPAEPSIATSRAGPPLLSLHAHKKVFSSCWRNLLSLPLPGEQVKRILGCLHRLVLPHLIEPRVLMDFLVDCTDSQDSAVGLLALDGLFTLLTKHNLDYPGFYEKLYGFLNREVMHVRYRARFLRMLDTFLSSTLLPVALVASFTKRLARLAISSPPAAIVTIIPFVYNLLKRHPTCMAMLHRPDGWPEGVESDPFNSHEKDPLKTKAFDSSLWELSTLRSHYLASIATLAKIFSEAFDKPGYDLEDFLDHSYATFFDTEVKRKVRKAPALGGVVTGAERLDVLFPTADSVSSPADEDSPPAGDIVSQMWVF